MLTCDVDHGEVFNVGPDSGEVTINQLLTTLKDLTDVYSSARHLPARPCEVKYATCSAEKIRKRFGYNATMPLRTGLTKLVAYIKKAGPMPFKYNLPLEIVNDKTPTPWVNKDF